MKDLKKYLFIFAALLASCILHAQKFTASVNKNKVAVAEVFQLDFTINASAKNFTPPSFADFTVYSGPNQSTSMQIVNGNMSQSITLSYYLAAKKEGTFTIGSASIAVGNSTLQSNAINIEAVKGGSTQQAQTQVQNGAPAKTNGQASSENLFARTTVSKSKVYSGEQIVITHKVYTRMNLKGFQNVKFPSYNGFWMQEVPRNTQYEVKAENVDGVTYNVVEVKKAFLFPQRSGKIEIEPLEVECVVREKSGKRNDPFSQFFGNDPFFGGMDAYKDAIYTVKSNAITIDVSPLPEAGKPADFPGAVGNFSMNATIDKDKVKANNGINLKITISGKGNLKLIDAPKINFPDEIESYDPKTNENITASENGVSGSKTFEYLLIPRHEGIYKIQPWNFTYFDAEKKNYVSLPSKEFTITVEKGDGNSASVPVISSVAKEDVKVFGNDIRYIKTDKIDLDKKGECFYGSPLFISGFAIPPLLFLAFLFFRREHIRRNSDLAMVRKRGAGRIAKKQLVQAEKSMKINDKENFFVNVLSALYSYAGNKMNIPVAELSKEKVVELLKEKNVEEDAINELVKLLDECEFARYAPGLFALGTNPSSGGQSGDLQVVYDRATNIITKIENEI
jgi:hypothetical protein